jgi:dihydroorotase-like cyclic amidohydrolase
LRATAGRQSLMVERDLSLAAYEGRPVHFLHLSARESVEAVRTARAAGIQATAEVTPHHLCLTDEAVRSLDSNLKMNPPLRSVDDRAALVEGIRDGTIAAIATDHAPHARHEKDVPFEAAPFGVTGLERRPPRSTRPGRAGPRQARPLLSACRPPAAIFGLPAAHRGRRAGEPRPARHESGLACAGRRVPLPLLQLLAPRGAPHGQGAHDGRGR